jgi:hypothetical protein
VFTGKQKQLSRFGFGSVSSKEMQYIFKFLCAENETKMTVGMIVSERNQLLGQNPIID